MKLNDEMRAAIDDARAQTYTTRRATVPALEEHLYEPTPCLDRGFVRVVDYMGDDAAVVAGGARFLRQGHQKAAPGPGFDPLPDAPQAHHAL